MGAVAPLPVDRYGALPKDLHSFLQPTVPYQLCSKTISSTECYLRRGIQHFEDSLMSAIAISLGMSSKKDLLKYIINNLDPITYISIANGHILYAFMDKESIVSTDKQYKTIIKQWYNWIKKYKNYATKIKIYNKSLDDIIDFLSGFESKIIIFLYFNILGNSSNIFRLS